MKEINILAQDKLKLRNVSHYSDSSLVMSDSTKH